MEQNSQNLDQSPIQNLSSEQIQPIVPPVPETPKPKFKIPILIVAIIVFLSLIGTAAAVFIAFQKPNTSEQKQIEVVLTPEPTTKDLDKWANPNLHNKVLFDDQASTLKMLDTATKEIIPVQFNFEKDNGHSSSTISPDKKKLLISYGSNFYIGSPNGSTYIQIDFKKIKEDLKGNFEIAPQAFSTDSMYIILTARDMSTFGNESCCEGGDNRKSTNKILALNLDTFEVKELYSLFSQLLHVDLYNPSKNLVGFSEFLNPGYHLLNLATKQPESTKKTFVSFARGYQRSEYFLAGENINSNGNPKSFSVYSTYDSRNKLGQVQTNSSSEMFGPQGIWSPDYRYFALWVFDEQNSSIKKLRIYSQGGKEVKTVQDNFDFEGIFSENSDSILYETITGESDYNLWKAVSIQPGGQDWQVDLPGTSRNFPIFWFR